jgi:hypothetical protein
LGYSERSFLRYPREKELIFPRELTEEVLKDVREIEREVEQKVNEALERLESRDDTPQYLKSMDKRLQIDFIKRILSGRKPTQNDWSNVLRKDVYDYEFDTSWHYYLILVIAGVLSLISVGYMGWNIYHSQTLLSYWNVFLGILIFAIIYDWGIFLTESLSEPQLSFSDEFLFYFVAGVIIVPSVAIRGLRSRDLDDLGRLPFMVWAPTIGYFTTIFMLNFVSWLVVALIWGIIIGGCISLAVIGSRKEARSMNPLKGILDVHGISK